MTSWLPNRRGPARSAPALAVRSFARSAGAPFRDALLLAAAIFVGGWTGAGAGDAGHARGTDVAAEPAVRRVVDDVDAGAVAVILTGRAAVHALATAVVEELVVGA